ncbi:MAG: hypothetical protein EXS16_00310 [Gemmataceae bacterium]|nr:hypothetical protein [Gemmataceae bacterium]
MPTPKEVAEWMIAQIEVSDELYQQTAAKKIGKSFGSEFVYRDEAGNLAIARRVLDQFRKLTSDSVVWVTHHGGGFCPDAYWRKREEHDAPGRTQYIEG